MRDGCLNSPKPGREFPIVEILEHRIHFPALRPLQVGFVYGSDFQQERPGTNVYKANLPERLGELVACEVPSQVGLG